MGHSFLSKFYLQYGCLLLALACLWPSPPVSAAEELSKILEGVRNKYGHLPGLSVTYKREIITRSSAMLGGPVEGDLATGQMYFKPPNLLMVRQGSPRPETVTTDGTTLWWYIPEKKLAYRYPAQELGEELRLLSHIFHGLRAVEDSFDIRLVCLDDKGERKLKLTPDPPWPEVQHLILSIGQGDYRIKTVEIHNYVGGITRFILGELSVQEKFEKDFFRFVVPEGVKVIQPERFPRE